MAYNTNLLKEIFSLVYEGQGILTECSLNPEFVSIRARKFLSVQTGTSSRINSCGVRTSEGSAA